MHQIPDVLVGFDFSKCGHPAQPNSIFNNPEQFAIGVLLYRGRCEIRSARIHPATGVSRCVAVEAMTRRAFGAVEFVSFFDARLQIGWCWGNTVRGCSDATRMCFALCRENGFDMAGLMKRVYVNLIESHDHDDGAESEDDKYNENPRFIYLIRPIEAIRETQRGPDYASALSDQTTMPL